MLTEVFCHTVLAAIADECSHKVSQMQIRNASKEDALRCVELVEARRKEYENYEPRFWKKAANSAASTLSWFEKLFSDEHNVSLVAVENTLIIGFLIAREFPTPQVYDPGGATALIDDFCVAAKDRWHDAGAALLQRAKSELNRRGFAQVVVVGAQRDAAKTALLSQANLSLASTWWTSEV
ncbi:GNAT family N-acetyltransferase [Agrobacterium tumefaciens]|nr:GNAT family N-acetyltransferase [Agrobacterium tumefaciens]